MTEQNTGRNLNEEMWERQAQERQANPYTGNRFKNVGIAGTAFLAGALVLGGIQAAFGGRNENPAPTAPAPAAAGDATPTPTEYATPTPTPTGTAEVTPTPTVEPTAMPSATPEVTASPTPEIGLACVAPREANGNWTITTPDFEDRSVESVEGFTPDGNLVLAPEWGEAMPLNPEQFADFQASLNDPDHPLVGYTYGYNDESGNLDYRRTLQAPMYSWTVLTGEEVCAPGIGHLVGGPGRAVELMIMNIDGSVADFGPDNPVTIRHGFFGTGRIWDGENVVEAERGISSHYVSRLQEGVTLPGESGFVGQCDLPENCNEVLVVAVVRRQWGFNEDGTQRFQYQLLRQELFSR
ncbi:MAG: hypothetical protein A2798_03510 [Candidatus Levybacteria bacterium RIFCSPHIGHO2_01_FULL_37_17]|nr:MAG: hypothetical protein A2798_03510 [Candidatus Levybacteria bacterium RIFCSPHIGHO2_01_FULL_37_17]OGH36543.1 MAG: hypothetical protein A2959_03565 [Candidatus Levybacteria bacterium RIFCSPLOWO2_01_FULL_38_23]